MGENLVGNIIFWQVTLLIVREITSNIHKKNSIMSFFQIYNGQMSKSVCIKITILNNFKNNLGLTSKMFLKILIIIKPWVENTILIKK